MNILTSGNPAAKVVVVCEAPPPKVFQAGAVMASPQLTLFAKYARENGFEKDDFCFVTCAPPMPEVCKGSEKREGEFLAMHKQEFDDVLKHVSSNARAVVYLGALAGRQLLGKTVKITRVRGQFDDTEGHLPRFAMFSPSHVLQRPENAPLFQSDFNLFGTVAKNDFNTKALMAVNQSHHYEWCLDIRELLANPPRAICLDTETKNGNKWMNSNVRVIVVQISYKEGHSLVIPLDCEYYPAMNPRQRLFIVGQLKQLLANPNVAVTGHNLKYDLHVLRKEGIEVANWKHDSMQLTFSVDENMLDKNLAEVTRRWVPRLAGYSDEFERTTNMERMQDVPHDKMLAYSGGDTDAGLTLTKLLAVKSMQDSRHHNTYTRIQMPALRTFFEMEEIGMRVDTERLADLGRVLKAEHQKQYESIIAQVPQAIRQKHVEDFVAKRKPVADALKLSRDDFVRDILFSKEGLNLTPIVFTDGTAKLPPEQRIPSISGKTHLPYFDDEPLVAELQEFTKLDTMLTKYVGAKGWTETITKKYKTRPDKIFTKVHEDTGFWKYLSEHHRIHPSFLLHSTNTGRTSSRGPNAQNFPKRGDLAKAYRRIFVPTPGYTFVEADLSQAELRLAAWSAMEPTMLRIYRNGGDIHEATAAGVMGVTIEIFQSWKDDETPTPAHLRVGSAKDAHTLNDLYELKRFQAKAVNFGFIYGMGWKKFMAYAKTEYGITFNEKEAKDIRAKFFAMYSGLEQWHKTMRAFVQEHGYVRALHGSVRHLENIYSDDVITRGECERQAINAPIQRFASDLGLIGLTRFGRDCDWEKMRPVAFIHDSIILEVKIEHAEEAARALRFYMQSPPLQAWFGIQSPIPIVSDVSIGENLGAMKKRPDIAAIAPCWFREELDLAA